MKTIYGYFIEGDGLICVGCSNNPQYEGLLTEAEKEGYPNGYTCSECGKVEQMKWYSKEYVCPYCDSYIEVKTKSSTLRDRNCMECDGELVLVTSNEITKDEPTINDIKREQEEASK